MNTDHFIFPPAPLKIHTAIKASLENSPASAAGLHVTVHLQKEGK